MILIRLRTPTPTPQLITRHWSVATTPYTILFYKVKSINNYNKNKNKRLYAIVAQMM